MPARRPTAAVLALGAVTAGWGSTFVLVKDVIDRVPVADFLAVRFLVAFVALLALFPGSVLRLTAREWRQGAALGLLYGGAQIVQTVALHTVPASVSGFLTGMYVVFTPFITAWLLGARLGRAVWVAVALATTGVGALTVQGQGLVALISPGTGELLTLTGALLYALHIVGLGVWSRSRNAVGLSVVQLGAIALLCGAAALPGGVALPSGTGDWAALLYMALVTGALALVVQTWAQASLSATRAAVIMTLEPVWAAGFAIGVGTESLTLPLLGGGALILAAMYLTELFPRGPGEPDVAEEVGSVTHLGPV